jgi:hypothetical protein
MIKNPLKKTLRTIRQSNRKKIIMMMIMMMMVVVVYNKITLTIRREKMS